MNANKTILAAALAFGSLLPAAQAADPQAVEPQMERFTVEIVEAPADQSWLAKLFKVHKASLVSGAEISLRISEDKQTQATGGYSHLVESSYLKGIETQPDGTKRLHSGSVSTGTAISISKAADPDTFTFDVKHSQLTSMANFSTPDGTIQVPATSQARLLANVHLNRGETQEIGAFELKNDEPPSIAATMAGHRLSKSYKVLATRN